MSKNNQYTGERFVDGEASEDIKFEHIERYKFASRFVKGKKCLDIACGTGYGSKILSDLGKAEEVIGGDISIEALDMAKGEEHDSKIRFKKVDCNSSLPFQDKDFDVIISFETIEHLSNADNFLAECKRVLKENGQIILSTPNRKITSPYTKKPINRFHLKEFYIDEFYSLLSKYFNEIKIYGQSFVLNNFKFKIRNFIRSYLGFVRPIYLLFKNKESKPKNEQSIREIGLEQINLAEQPTYAIYIIKK